MAVPLLHDVYIQQRTFLSIHSLVFVICVFVACLYACRFPLPAGTTTLGRQMDTDAANSNATGTLLFILLLCFNDCVQY
jgi:hypothetical protein